MISISSVASMPSPHRNFWGVTTDVSISSLFCHSLFGHSTLCLTTLSPIPVYSLHSITILQTLSLSPILICSPHSVPHQPSFSLSPGLIYSNDPCHRWSSQDTLSLNPAYDHLLILYFTLCCYSGRSLSTCIIMGGSGGIVVSKSVILEDSVVREGEAVSVVMSGRTDSSMQPLFVPDEMMCGWMSMSCS